MSGGPLSGFGRDLAATLRGSADGIRAVREEGRARKEAERSGTLVARAPDAVLDEATVHMTSRRFTVQSRTPNSVTFTNYVPPNGLVGVLLLLLFIVPGVLYLILAGKRVGSVVAVTAQPEGCRVLVDGESAKGYNELRRWVAGLPEAVPGEVLATTTPETGPLTIPDQIKKLAELRDAGIVTEEEFEGKKAELLKRL